jgi:hypothetical protein
MRNKFSAVTFVGSALCFAAALLFSACPPIIERGNVNDSVRARRMRKVLIWCDVTKSLLDTERGKVADLAADILDRLPADAEYALYPIQKETETPTDITRVDASVGGVDEIPEGVKEARRKDIKGKMEQFYKDANAPRQPDQRTCILNTLGFAERYFRDTDRQKYEPTLIYISDMIEQCKQTPLGRAIDLKNDPHPELFEAAEAFAAPPDLSYATIYVIIPTTEQTFTVPPGQRPTLDDRIRFWNIIFRKCQVGEGVIKGMGWLPEVPNAL